MAMKGAGYYSRATTGAKDVMDNATPSGNSLAAELRLAPVWDSEPLQQVLNQLHAGFRYYHFNDVDKDRVKRPDHRQRLRLPGCHHERAWSRSTETREATPRR